ncbi:MAG: DUF6370 family protein [Polaribacter sp.]|uniref:DUF6370 family protein n=1 Tax=Polaribacter sp. TaxID=1920175 RepID=UPI00326341A4
MKKLLFLSVFMIAFSCGNKKEITQIAAVSCGQCKFELDSEKGCSLAVKIDDKTYFVDGFGIDDFGDAHDKHVGFCNVVRQAEITGVIEGGRFKASALKLVE